MFSPQPIGHVRSTYQTTKEIPKGLGAKHDAEGVLEILQEFEAGLTDIEGFSHLFVLWVFNRSEGCDLVGVPPIDNLPARRFLNPISAPSKPDRIDCRRTSPSRWQNATRSRPRHARWHTNPRPQALSIECAAGKAAARVARTSRSALANLIPLPDYDPDRLYEAFAFCKT